MIPDQVTKYRAHAHFIRALLIYGGIWPRSKPSFFYQLLPIFLIFCGTVIILALGNFCWQNVTDLSLATKGLGLFVSFCAVLFKIVLFSVCRKDICKVHEQLESLFEEALKDLRLHLPLLSLLRLFHRLTQATTLCTCFVMAIYALRPPIVIARQLITGATTKVYLLVFPGSYPWSVHSSMFLYAFHYIFEAQFAWFAACVTSGVDSLFGFYMFQMSGILRVLAYKIQNVKTTDDHQELLLKCITVHSQLIGYRNIVQKVFGPIVLLMALTNALIMCSILFQAVHSGGMTFGVAILSIIYIFAKITQTFVYAWCGNTLSEESEALQREIYCSDWYENKNRTYKTGILLLIMQRPITLTACHFFNISFEFFVRILSTALSYFFLLQTLDDSG